MEFFLPFLLLSFFCLFWQRPGYTSYWLREVVVRRVFRRRFCLAVQNLKISLELDLWSSAGFLLTCSLMRWSPASSGLVVSSHGRGGASYSARGQHAPWSFSLSSCVWGPLPIVSDGGWWRSVVLDVVRCWRAIEDGACSVYADSGDGACNTPYFKILNKIS